MENMPQKVDRLVEYVSQSVSLWRRLQKKKVSLETAKLAFTQIDTKRKGFLDLANVYQLCGEVTQNQLFHVFKWLDTSKSGDITLTDIQNTLVNTEKITQSNTQAIAKVKQVITAFVQNIEYLQGLRKKFNFSQQFLQNFHRQICQNRQTQYLTLDDLVGTLKQSKKWDDWCTQQIKKMFKGCRNITVKVLFEVFISGWLTTEHENTKGHSHGHNHAKINTNATPYYTNQNQQQLLDGICDSSLGKVHKSSTQNSSPRFKQLNQTQTYKPNANSDFKYQWKQRQTTSNQVSKAQNIGIRNYGSTFTFMQAKQTSPDVDSVISNIQKRREQLRRGSIQRKKLIQDTMQRKKQVTSFNTSTDIPKWTDSKYSAVQPNYSKINEKQQFSPKNFNIEAMNPHDRSEFTKFFGKQRRQNPLQLQQTLNKSKSSYFQQPYMKSSYIQQKARNFDNQFQANRQTSPVFETRSNQRFYTPKDNSNLNLQSRNYHQKLDKYKYYDEKQVELSQNNKQFSLTMKQRLYERPSSSYTNTQKQNYQDLTGDANIQKIIQKYNRENGSPSQCYQNQYQNKNRYKLEQSEEPFRQKPEKYQPRQMNLSGLCNSDLNSNNYSVYSNAQYFQKNGQRSSVQRQAPHSYLRDQQKGKIYRSIEMRPRSNSIQKQNILKRAQQQATRKIQQIERRAKMKVLERKSSAGFKWIK